MKTKNQITEKIRILVLISITIGIILVFPNNLFAGTPEDNLVNLANSQEGKKAADYGFTADWCAWFVEWCGYHSGLTEKGLFPGNKSIGRVTDLCNWFIDNDKGTAYYALPGELHTSKNSQRISRSSFTPQKGDLICFTWSGVSNERYDHVGIVTNYSNGTVYYTHGNSGSTGSYKTNYVRVNTPISRTSTSIAAYIRPNYQALNQQPIFNLEAVSGGAGTVTVTGWAFDPDSPNTSVGIHVYIGGVCGESNAEGHGWIVADQESSDVNQAYGISGKHRFSTTIETSKRGNQKIAVYALDTGGGENPLIGLNTVYIAKPYVLEFDQDSITVKEGETKSFTLKYDGENITQIGGRWEDNTGVASCTWGTLDENAHTLEVIIGGIKAGKDQATIQLLGAGGTVLFSKSMPITVNHVHQYTIEKVTKEATCSSTGLKKYYCSCGAVSSQTTTIAKKSHMYVTDAAVAATCTQAGKTAGKHCSVCGYVLTAQTTIPAKGHSYVTDAAVAATCTQAGKTAGKHCSVCGYVQTKQQTIAAKGHSYVTDAAKAATCTQAGKTAGKHCSVCGYVLTKQETIAAKGHSYVTDSAKEATCKEEGKTEGKHCSICGYVAIAQTSTPMKAHSFENGVCIWCGTHSGNLSNDEEEDNEPPTNTDKNDSVQDSDEDDDLLTDSDEQEGDEANVITESQKTYFEKGNLKFKIINAKKKQVMVLRCLNKNSKKIVIPTNIKYNGVTYSVVSIGSNAFSSLKNLEVVTIGRNVTTIGKKAFYNCGKIKAFHIKTTKINKVEKEAFGKLRTKCRVYVEDKMIKKYKKLFYKSGMNKKIRIS